MNKYWKCEYDFNLDTPFTSTKNMRIPPEIFFGVGDVAEVVMMHHVASLVSVLLVSVLVISISTVSASPIEEDYHMVKQKTLLFLSTM